MLTLISPAKKLLPETKPYSDQVSVPRLIDQANQLAQLMKTKSVEEIAQLMKLSPDLAKLNYGRFQEFVISKPSLNQCYPALFLFQGDVYQGLQATEWQQDDLTFAQSHLGILSGLYGLLKPLDEIQPYRLEMGVRLNNPQGTTLYQFWRENITGLINDQLATHKQPVLLNLASTEYFKVVDQKRLNYPIVTINFYEQKKHEVKMIGFFAKKARGLMARYLIQNRIEDLEQIKDFKEQGYSFNSNTSSTHHLDFIRTHT